MTLFSSSSDLSGCAKALCPFHSSTKVLSPAVDLIHRPTLLLYDNVTRIFIASNWTEVLVLFTSLQIIVISSITVIVHAGVKSTNVVCPHNETNDLCIFAIFSKTCFVDIVPLCCKPSTSYKQTPS